MLKFTICIIGIAFCSQSKAVTKSFQNVPIHFLSSDFTTKNPKYLSIILKNLDLLSKIASEDEIISSVKKQNAEKLDKKIILERDLEWKSTLKETKTKKMLKIKKASRFLKYVTTNKHSDLLSEAFLTDNQGANVAAFPLTSDYWQGDEAKWQKAMNSGKCQIVIGDVNYDDSADSKIIQISIPVYDGEFGTGNCIGVLVMGIKDLYIRKNL